MQFFKKLLIWGIIGAAFYVLLAYHYIVIDKSIKMLPKTKLSLKYTFYSTKGRTTENILDIDELWDAGIADLFIQEGVMTKEDLERYKAKYADD
ncbi:MAG: hypothetical protein JW932_19380 [Deltaproteobacteria bacterium]|nr:hypothetical protein [Deltaproteobacteria bacterium]